MSNVLIAVLVAVLAWPWNLTLPAADSADSGALERPHAHFRAKRSTSHRAARARRWLVSTTTAYWEDNDGEEERGGKDVGPGQMFGESSADRFYGYPRPETKAVPSSIPHLLGISLDRLCRLRC